MTPQDIQNKRFDKSMGGYKTEEVHQFLAEVAGVVSSLEQDKADLEQKMEVLAERLEEYREDEDSLRAALIGAQKLGDSVVRESKRKAEAIISGAVRKAEEIAEDAQRKIDEEAYELERMKREVSSFKSQVMELYKQHLKVIDCLPDGDVEVEVPQITYTPPASETVKIDIPAEDGGDSVTEEFAVSFSKHAEPEVDSFALSEEPDDGQLQSVLAGGGESRRGGKRLREGREALGRMFGDDHPVERE